MGIAFGVSSTAVFVIIPFFGSFQVVDGQSAQDFRSPHAHVCSSNAVRKVGHNHFLHDRSITLFREGNGIVGQWQVADFKRTVASGGGSLRGADADCHSFQRSTTLSCIGHFSFDFCSCILHLRTDFGYLFFIEFFSYDGNTYRLIIGFRKCNYMCTY